MVGNKRVTKQEPVRPAGSIVNKSAQKLKPGFDRVLVIILARLVDGRIHMHGSIVLEDGHCSERETVREGEKHIDKSNAPSFQPARNSGRPVHVIVCLEMVIAADSLITRSGLVLSAPQPPRQATHCLESWSLGHLGTR